MLKKKGKKMKINNKQKKKRKYDKDNKENHINNISPTKKKRNNMECYHMSFTVKGEK